MSQEMDQLQRILIVGTGAIGALYAWRLQKSGNCHVTCVCRSNYEAVAKNGFSLKSHQWKEDIFRPNRLCRSVQEAVTAETEKYDYIVVCTKILPEQLPTTDLIEPAVTEGHTVIVLLQNGVGIEQPIVERFPRNPCISGAAYVGVTQTAPGKIEHIIAGHIRVAMYNDGKQEIKDQAMVADADRFARLLRSGGVECHTFENLQPLRWHKTAWNAAFGAAAVLTGLHDTHTMLNDTDCRQLIYDVMNEIWEAAKKIFGDDQFPGSIKPETAEIFIAWSHQQPPYRPSILIDYIHGHSMETEVIFGNTVQIAKNHGIPMPRLETLYRMMRIVDRKTSV